MWFKNIMGGTVINLGTFNANSGPRPPKPQSSEFFGVITDIEMYGKKDFLLTVATAHGEKKILLGEGLLPSDNLSTEQKRLFTCRPNITNSCAAAAWRASKTPSDIVAPHQALKAKIS